jgi:hypothetical protein
MEIQNYTFELKLVGPCKDGQWQKLGFCYGVEGICNVNLS